MSTRTRRKLSYEENQQPAAEVCALCKVHHDHMSHPLAWKNEKAGEFISEQRIEQHQKICRPCRDDISRIIANPAFKPRWEKKENVHECCIQDCKQSSYVISKIATKESLKLANSLQHKGDELPNPSPLCKSHYEAIYASLNPKQSQNCGTCGISLINQQSRPCPNPEIIVEYLGNAGFTVSLSDGDKVCFACYKLHLAIIQHDKQLSKDSDLQELLDEIQSRVKSISKLSTLNDVQALALDKVLADIAEQLLQRKAILLPTVRDIFHKYCSEILQSVNLKGIDRSNVQVTSIWLLSNLKSELQQHLACTCVPHKYGTLLYRSNTDLSLLPQLHQALWKLCQYETKYNEIPDVPDPPIKHVITEATVLDKLNVAFQEQCKSFLAKDREFFDQYHNFDIDEVIECINPQLWNAICVLTRSVSEKKGTHKINPQASAQNIKKQGDSFFCALCFV